MENWDQAQLEEVVKKKQKGALPETDIVRTQGSEAARTGVHPCSRDDAARSGGVAVATGEPGVQVLFGCCRKEPVRLVLGVPQRRWLPLPVRPDAAATRPHLMCDHTSVPHRAA